MKPKKTGGSVAVISEKIMNERGGLMFIIVDRIHPSDLGFGDSSGGYDIFTYRIMYMDGTPFCFEGFLNKSLMYSSLCMELQDLNVKDPHSFLDNVRLFFDIKEIKNEEL